MPGRGTRDIQVGVSAESYVAVPGMALRTAGMQIKSSGSGRPLPLVDASAAFAHLLQQVAAGTIDLEVQAVPLACVEEAWAWMHARDDQRIVFVP